MIAVIPVFLINNRFWEEDQLGNDFLLQNFRAVLTARHIDRVLVFSDSVFILQLAASVHIETYKLVLEEKEEPELLPVGTFVSLRFIDQVMKLAYTGIMVVNYKNPLINACILEKAVNRYLNTNKTVLISMKKMTDHPFQLNRYYKIVDAGVMHVFDRDEVAEPHLSAIKKWIEKKSLESNCHVKISADNMRKPTWKITRPFHFDWKSRKVNEPGVSGAYYIQQHHLLETTYLNIDDPGIETICSSLVWLHEGPNTARMIVRLEQNETETQISSGSYPSENVIGGAFFNHGCSLLLYNRPDSDFCRLLVSGDLPLLNKSLLRLIPVTSCGPQYGREKEITVDRGMNSLFFPCQIDTILCFLYFVLVLTEDGCCHLKESFIESEGKRNEENCFLFGESQPIGKMNGRQVFPEVVEPDKTFCILGKDQWKGIKKKLRTGKVASYLIPELSSVLIESEFDILRYKALLRVKE